MRSILAFLAVAAIAAVFQLSGTEPVAAQCSVLSHHPCNPGGCSVLSHHPCNPYGCSVLSHHPCNPAIQYPIGQDLRLTIVSQGPLNTPDGVAATAGPDTAGAAPPGDHELDTIRDMFDALRACWVPPPADEARPGMQMSVRLSFKRDGGVIGTPRVTYASHDAPDSAKDVYHDAITEALKRCTPLPFSAGLGGAVAGRPIMIRFVDERTPA
jgi:hypothetical protein